MPATAAENGQPIAREPRGDRNRRRGRRGGKNRPRGDRPRREDGSIGNPIRSEGSSDAAADGSESTQPAARGNYEPVPTSYSSSGYNAPTPAAQPSRQPSIIGLSEKQTNPAAIASPITSQSSGETGAKKKGWWSRVLES